MTQVGFISAVVLGGVLGAAYFAALWATVRVLPGVRNPALVLLAGFLVRFALMAVAFVGLIRWGGWPWAAAALAGFMAARLIAVRRLLPAPPAPPGGAR